MCVLAAQDIVRADYNILLSVCLSCLNFDRFIVLTSVGFGTRVQHGKAIIQQCIPRFYDFDMFDKIIAVSALRSKHGLRMVLY